MTPYYARGHILTAARVRWSRYFPGFSSGNRFQSIFIDIFVLFMRDKFHRTWILKIIFKSRESPESRKSPESCESCEPDSRILNDALQKHGKSQTNRYAHHKVVKMKTSHS